MRMLILGGTQFVGRAIAERAVANGHAVTLFNRGNNRDVLPDVPRIVGDRNVAADVERLAGTGWDCVVDVNAYHPSAIRLALGALRDVARYVFISTISVYADPSPGEDESATLIEVDEAIPRGDATAYGGLKVLCERVLHDALGDRLTVLRPTIVIGPHDPTDRFPWYVRAVAGGASTVPPRLAQPIQLIDAADLGRFAVRAAEQGIAGVFNVAGPPEPLTLGGMIDTIADPLGVSFTARPAVADALPLTRPRDGSDDGVFMLNIGRAVHAGLQHTDLHDTARAVHAWIEASAAR